MDPRLTAFAIARIRAEEGARGSGALFADPYASLFDDPQIDVDPLFESIPFFREHVRLRTRFLDDTVRSALAAGVRSIVLVGAGFDCRALRMKEIADAGAMVFEVDHGGQLEAKRERLARARVEIPSSVRFASADLGDERLETSLPEALRGAGLAPGAKVLWLCEGLVGYLSPPAVGRLGAATGVVSGPGSSLVANYFVHTWSAATLAELLRAGGWTVGEGPSFGELHRRWLGDAVPPGSELFAFVVAGR